MQMMAVWIGAQRWAYPITILAPSHDFFLDKEILVKVEHSDGFATYNPVLVANLQWQEFSNFVAIECLQRI